MIEESPALKAWLTRLESFSPSEIELGLDRVRAVLDRLALSVPELVLVVGGTNGKGSSVRMLHELLQASGVHTGSYTSPHLRIYNERVRIGDELASDAALVASFERVEAARGDVPLTYFEYGTLAALVCFADAGLDAWVLEVGLGGRLDAVNAVEPTASLITNVALDHCDWLGDTIPLIAREKAGIMRAGKPVVFAGSDVPDVIIDHAARLGADLKVAHRDYSFSRDDKAHWSYDGLNIARPRLATPALAGDHQLANAAGALALLECAGVTEALSADRINAVLSAISVPGRMQRLDHDGHWLFDVAHNPASAASLRRALSGTQERGRTIALLGILADKEVESVLLELAPVVDQWVVFTADSPRAVAAGSLAEAIASISDADVTTAESATHAVSIARRLRAPDDLCLVTGSFFAVGPVLAALGL